MDFIKKNNKILQKIIFSFIILSIISVILFIKFKFHVLIGSGDIPFHIKRIFELKDGVEHNTLPLFAFNYFHGSAIMSTYPYFSILPFVFLLIITSSVYYSYYLFFVLIIFISLIIAFFSSLNFSKSIKISYLFSLIYSLSSSFVFEVFTNGDFGVATSLVFLPLAIFGFVDIFTGYNNFLKLSLGITFMAFCQLSAVTIVSIFLILWALFNIKNIDKKIITKLSESSITIILLTSIIWIPLFHVLLLNNINTVLHMSLISPNLKLFIENLNIIPLISVIMIVFYFNKLKKIEKQMYIIAIIFIIFSSKLMPWQFITSIKPFTLLNIFQFSFRFLIVPNILLSYLFSVICVKYLHKSYIYIFCICVVILLQLSTQFLVIHKDINSDNIHFYDYNDVERYFINSSHLNYEFLVNNKRSFNYFINGYFPNKDYYPKISSSKLNYLYNNNGNYNITHKISIHHCGYNTFSFYNKFKIHQLVLPLLHYNGENLQIYLDNHRVSCYTNKQHLIVIRNVMGGEHIFIIKYIPSNKLLIFEWLLLISGLYIIIIKYDDI